MRAFLVLLSCGALAACDSASVPEGEASSEASSSGSIMPEAIRYPDIEKHEIYGASCAFVPDGGGLGAIAIAMADAGYMHLDGTIERFEPDRESAELPLGARQMYRSELYRFDLLLEEDEGTQSGYESSNFDARLTVRDRNDAVVFEATGLAQCGV